MGGLAVSTVCVNQSQEDVKLKTANTQIQTSCKAQGHSIYGHTKQELIFQPAEVAKANKPKPSELDVQNADSHSRWNSVSLFRT